MIKVNSITPERAIQRAQALCARHEKCSHDIRLKLQQWQLSTSDIEKIVKQLTIDNFISDERYAKIYVRDKSRFNKWGSIKIAQALRAKHIPEAIIRESLKEIASSDEEGMLTNLLKKKAASTKARTSSDLKAKLIRFGVSRGFDFSMTICIINKILKID
ncbi:MAG: RecX family transcriptional regulator [Bacteroidales bacterium]|nr:MAG: RecX family transcriptional regulator [Bacteroidales bacterium]